MDDAALVGKFHRAGDGAQQARGPFGRQRTVGERRDDGQAQACAKQGKDILYEKGGTALLAHLRQLAVPSACGVADELRKLINYFADNEHRTDYPSDREHGWDIGSGPTEAACKVVGARLKQSGMRWLEEGAATVAPLRALYLSGPSVWDAFWAMAA